MKTRTLVCLAMFVAVGAVLHFIIPSINGTMKPDMMLAMMFLGILLFPDKKNVLVLGIATGILSGLTTTFPGGLIPNIIDKPITAFAFYGLYLLIAKKNQNLIAITFLTVIGTLISGLIFLGSAFLFFELPVPFPVLFVSAVLPALVLNAVAMFILYPSVKAILGRARLIEQVQH